MHQWLTYQKKNKKKYPNDKGGFYEKRIDTENPKVYDLFITCLSELNKKMKSNEEENSKPKKTEIKLPKLKKIK